MRIWVVLVVLAFGCKKSADKANVGSGSSAQTAGDAALVALADAHAPAVPDAPAPAPIDPNTLLDTETIGSLKYGMSDIAVTKVLRAPIQRTPVVDEPATGSFVSDWTYDGVVLHMAGEQRSGPSRVVAITVTKPGLATGRGIKVGSTLADVAAAYPRAPESADDPDAFLVGSVYGGLLFKLEKAVVTEIFLGAAAE